MLSTLYTFRRCPYAMRARLAITYAGISMQYREVELKNKPQTMLDVSAKGTVPILVLKNGQVIDESLDIMLWALKQHDPASWLAHKKHALSLIEENDSTFKSWLDKYKYANRFPKQSQIFYREQGCVFLQKLEQCLQQNTCLCAQQHTLADFAIFPFVRQFASVDNNWFEQSPYPKLQTWLDTHLKSPLFKKIMVKHPIWVQE